MKFYKSARTLARLFAKQPLMRDWIGQFALYYTDVGTNFSYDIASNGEAWLMEACGILRPKVIVDVGANVGEWTLRAARVFPGARLFSFEPNPSIYEELRHNTAALPSVTCVQNAIAVENGLRDLYIQSGSQNIGVSSLTKFDHHDTGVIVPTIRGDDWMKSSKVEQIDFMKIDVEGYEFGVLRSFEAAFRGKRITVVQLEFAVPNPIERVFLRDIYNFAVANGYLVGRLYQKFVLFKDYEIRDEWWHGPNYVLCDGADRRAVEALENKKARKFFMEYLSLH